MAGGRALACVPMKTLLDRYVVVLYSLSSLPLGCFMVCLVVLPLFLFSLCSAHHDVPDAASIDLGAVSWPKNSMQCMTMSGSSVRCPHISED